ncbi:phage tail protein [Caballeronia ptereochthonis]|uniref:Phage tail protein n=1 Tax=Caballeronia ptereochthonis TaxID=1777144 RepID=A0A158DYT5_9BURK|nr:phage tail protein [Caballeronia ptereochthonis]SAK99738.1 hypothetical protein AWB83_06135 [Caballeronia ptereochthonis]
MSSLDDLRQYRFATAAQWGSGLSSGLGAGRAGGLVADGRSVLSGRFIAQAGGAATPALDGTGAGIWRTGDGRLASMRPDEALPCVIAVDGVLAASPRLVIGRGAMWAFMPGASELVRFDAASLIEEVTIAVPGIAIVDVAGDGRGGVWVLVDEKRADTAQTTAGTPDTGPALMHADARGRIVRRASLAATLTHARGMAWLAAAQRIVILTGDGGTLAYVDPRAPQSCALLPLASVVAGFVATTIGSDRHGRALIAGGVGTNSADTLLIVDASGALLASVGPDDLSALANAGPMTGLAASDDSVLIAARRGVVWLNVGAAAAQRSPVSAPVVEAGAAGVFLTPTLFSPVTATLRGWLRAELEMDLPPGASATVTRFCTDDPALRDALDTLLRDQSQLSQVRIARFQARFAAGAIRAFRFDAPDSGANAAPGTAAPATRSSLAVPLFGVPDRWLWVCVELHGAAALHALRVLYPEVSLMEQLPAIYRGRRLDQDVPAANAAGLFRSLVGVLEAMTQEFDRTIARSGARVAPLSADIDWLDFVARWIDLPWSDALSIETKRALLSQAGALLTQRGTRAGLVLLFRCLLPHARVTIVDVEIDLGFARLGGVGRPGAVLPALLTGLPPEASMPGRHARLGNARLCRQPDTTGTARFRGWIRIGITASASDRAALEPLATALANAMTPAGMRVRIVWRTVADDAHAPGSNVLLRLDDESARRLARDAWLGLTILDAGHAVRLSETGPDAGFRLD